MMLTKFVARFVSQNIPSLCFLKNEEFEHIDCLMRENLYQCIDGCFKDLSIPKHIVDKIYCHLFTNISWFEDTKHMFQKLCYRHNVSPVTKEMASIHLFKIDKTIEILESIHIDSPTISIVNSNTSEKNNNGNIINTPKRNSNTIASVFFNYRENRDGIKFGTINNECIHDAIIRALKRNTKILASNHDIYTTIIYTCIFDIYGQGQCKHSLSNANYRLICCNDNCNDNTTTTTTTTDVKYKYNSKKKSDKKSRLINKTKHKDHWCHIQCLTSYLQSITQKLIVCDNYNEDEFKSDYKYNCDSDEKDNKWSSDSFWYNYFSQFSRVYDISYPQGCISRCPLKLSDTHFGSKHNIDDKDDIRLLHPTDIISALIFLFTCTRNGIKYYNYFDDNNDTIITEIENVNADCKNNAYDLKKTRTMAVLTPGEIKIYPLIKWFKCYRNMILVTLDELEIELLKSEYVVYATKVLRLKMPLLVESKLSFELQLQLQLQESVDSGHERIYSNSMVGVDDTNLNLDKNSNYTFDFYSFHRNLVVILQILIKSNKACPIGWCLVFFPISALLANIAFKESNTIPSIIQVLNYCISIITILCPLLTILTQKIIFLIEERFIRTLGISMFEEKDCKIAKRELWPVLRAYNSIAINKLLMQTFDFQFVEQSKTQFYQASSRYNVYPLIIRNDKYQFDKLWYLTFSVFCFSFVFVWCIPITSLSITTDSNYPNGLAIGVIGLLLYIVVGITMFVLNYMENIQEKIQEAFERMFRLSIYCTIIGLSYQLLWIFVIMGSKHEYTIFWDIEIITIIVACTLFCIWSCIGTIIKIRS